VASAPLLYRGITGRWPDVLNGYGERNSSKSALGGDRGVHVRESIRLEVSVGDVYRLWRRLENLPRFMTHLDRVTEGADGLGYFRSGRLHVFRDLWDLCIPPSDTKAQGRR
jgi:hypothetical protein